MDSQTYENIKYFLLKEKEKKFLSGNRKMGYQDGILCSISMVRGYFNNNYPNANNFPFDRLDKKIFIKKYLNAYEEEYNEGIKKGIEIITREIKIGEK